MRKGVRGRGLDSSGSGYGYWEHVDLFVELTQSVQVGAAVKVETWIWKAFHGCPKTVQINAGVLPPFRHDHIISNPSHFIVYYHPTVQFYKAGVAS